LLEFPFDPLNLWADWLEFYDRLLEFPFIPSSELGLFNGLASFPPENFFRARFRQSHTIAATKSAAPWHDRPALNSVLKIKSHNRTFGKKMSTFQKHLAHLGGLSVPWLLTR
jgi:hypothetical protein